MAASDQHYNQFYTVVDGVANLVFLIDDYNLILPDNVSITPNDWHWFTHLMLEASELWHLYLPA